MGQCSLRLHVSPVRHRRSRCVLLFSSTQRSRRWRASCCPIVSAVRIQVADMVVRQGESCTLARLGNGPYRACWIPNSRHDGAAGQLAVRVGCVLLFSSTSANGGGALRHVQAQAALPHRAAALIALSDNHIGHFIPNSDTMGQQEGHQQVGCVCCFPERARRARVQQCDTGNAASSIAPSQCCHRRSRSC